MTGGAESAVVVAVEDDVRHVSDRVELHQGWTVAATVRHLVRHFGLPWHSVGRKTLTYRLARPGPEDDERFFTPDQTVGALDLVAGETLVLSSPDAGPVWAEIDRMVGQVESELRLQATTARDEVTGEIRADVSRRLTAIRADIDREARGRIGGAASKVPLLRRLRARRLMRRVARTGAVPDEVAGVRVGLSQLTTAASYAWKAAPFVIGATVAAAGAGAVAVIDDPGDGGGDGPGSLLTEDAVRSIVAENVDRAIEAQLSEEDMELAVLAALADLDVGGNGGGLDIDVDIDALARAVAEQLPELIRREVPGAEVDGVASVALGNVSRTSPIRSLEPNDTLWAIAVETRNDPAALGCQAGPFEESVAVYVRRIWAANAGSLGGDPDRIDPVDQLRVPCPS